MSKSGFLLYIRGEEYGRVMSAEDKTKVAVYRDEIKIPESQLKRWMPVTYDLRPGKRLIDKLEAYDVRAADVPADTPQPDQTEGPKGEPRTQVPTYSLTPEERVRDLIAQLERPRGQSGRSILLNRLCGELRAGNPKLWLPVPASILVEEPVWSSASVAVKLSLLSRAAGNRSDPRRDEYLTRLAETVRAVPVARPSKLLALVPDDVAAERVVFEALPSEEQLAVALVFLQDGKEAPWQFLPEEQRILAIYVAVYKNWSREILKDSDETDPLVACALSYLHAEPTGEGGGESFLRAHKLIEDYVVDEAYRTDGLLELDPLLPRCPNHVVPYCEGRPWIKPEEKARGVTVARRAWCPRLRKVCEFGGRRGAREHDWDHGYRGARLYANRALSRRDWTLLELMDARGVVPSLVGLRRPDEYVPRLSGWVNRLNEIRPRLKCKTCGEIMVPNYAYAKFLAVFNATVFHCPEPSHASVYINYCWGCQEIIDSRESRFKRAGYHICIHCGRGPKDDPDFEPGDLCPKCGTDAMRRLSESRFECRACPHTIDTAHELGRFRWNDGTSPEDPVEPD